MGIPRSNGAGGPGCGNLWINDDVLHAEFHDFYPESDELTIGAEDLKRASSS